MPTRTDYGYGYHETDDARGKWKLEHQNASTFKARCVAAEQQNNIFQLKLTTLIA